MKIAKSLAVAAGLVIGGLNISAQTTNPEQAAQRETTEMKTYVTGITSDEESQIITVELDHAKSTQNAENTITDKYAMQAEKRKLYNSRNVKIKAILTTDQFRQYMKVEKREKHYIYHNSRWLDVYYI